MEFNLISDSCRVSLSTLRGIEVLALFCLIMEGFKQKITTAADVGGGGGGGRGADDDVVDDVSSS